MYRHRKTLNKSLLLLLLLLLTTTTDTTTVTVVIVVVVVIRVNTSRRYLHSATYGDLLVPRMRTVTYAPQSFAVLGPTVCNTLPSTLRVSTTTLGQFQSGVKTILFRLAYGT